MKEASKNITKRILGYGIILIIVLQLTGCVPHSKNYQPPTKKDVIVNYTTIAEKKDVVWKKLINNISSNFFVINNMDKESGFINVSYSGSPKEYVDGGRLTYNVSNLRGSRNYSFEASSPNQTFETVINNDLCVLNRQLDLEGRININLIEIDSCATKVTVNVKYVLNLNMTGRNVLGQTLLPYSETISFETQNYGITTGGTKFYPNGELEKKILDMVVEDNEKKQGEKTGKATNWKSEKVEQEETTIRKEEIKKEE